MEYDPRAMKMAKWLVSHSTCEPTDPRQPEVMALQTRNSAVPTYIRDALARPSRQL